MKHRPGFYPCRMRQQRFSHTHPEDGQRNEQAALLPYSLQQPAQFFGGRSPPPQSAG